MVRGPAQGGPLPSRTLSNDTTAQVTYAGDDRHCATAADPDTDRRPGNRPNLGLRSADWKHNERGDGGEHNYRRASDSW